MATVLGDITYPDYIRNWDLNDGFKGSLLLGQYQNTDEYPTIVFGEVLEIPFPIIDYSQYLSENYYIDLWEFSNGVKIKLAMRFYDTGNFYTYTAALEAWYNNNNIGLFNTGRISPTGDQSSVQSIGMPPGSGGGQGTRYTINTTVAQGHNIKAFICTEYSANPVETVTHPTRVSFNVLFPCMFAFGTYPDMEGVMQTYDNVISGVQCRRDVWSWVFSSGGEHASAVCAIGYPCQWMDVMYNVLNQANPFTPGSDPWDSKLDPEDDPSVPGGGGGQYEQESDPIDFPTLPTGGALASGALRAFMVNPAIMRSVFQKLWNTSVFDIPTQFQKLVEDPMECIISFHAIPVLPSTDGTGHIMIGNLDTEIDGYIIDSQYVTVDCGSISVKECWGSALDYGPYTKCEIYMPFIGIKELKIEDVMKNTVHIKYNIDIFTGDCLCNIKCGQSILYKFSGNLKQDIPVSSKTSDVGIRTLTGILSSIAGAQMGLAVGGPVGSALAAGNLLSSAASVAGSKVVTSRSGSLSGSIGLLDDFRPFFIFHRPVQSLANRFKTFKGYPSNITKKLSAVRGYTEVEYINLQNIPNATSAEMDEIKDLLRSGVLL